MPEAERLATLSQLETKQRELLSTINRLPLSRDSEASRKHAQALEAQLRQVEGMIQALSHEKVYIKA
jgi:TolA-binding protein